MSSWMLRVTDLWKGYAGRAGRVEVLRGVELALAGGETLALTGESGSGKSTLLHLVAGLDAPDRGRVELDGTDLAAAGDAGRARIRRETVGIVFQQFNLIPSLDAAANVAFQARLAGRHDPDRTEALIARLGLSDHRAKYPEQLSGGQQQRVAIGRALACRPRLILADEPTGNLDEETGARVLDLMLELVAEAGAALLLVTHSRRMAARAARQLRLEHGRIARPAGRRAAE
jgi:putative ABC transport system ATP-binding protein